MYEGNLSKYLRKHPDRELYDPAKDNRKCKRRKERIVKPKSENVAASLEMKMIASSSPLPKEPAVRALASVASRCNPVVKADGAPAPFTLELVDGTLRCVSRQTAAYDRCDCAGRRKAQLRFKRLLQSPSALLQ